MLNSSYTSQGLEKEKFEQTHDVVIPICHMTKRYGIPVTQIPYLIGELKFRSVIHTNRMDLEDLYYSVVIYSGPLYHALKWQFTQN